MLIDSDVRGSTFHLAVGVGINVNETVEPSELGQSATSLSMIKNQPLPRELLLAQFCNHLEATIALNFDQVVQAYDQHNILRKGTQLVVMPKKYEDESAWYEAISLGIETQDRPNKSCLKVQKKDGSICVLCAEEVSVRPYLQSLKETPK